MDEIARYNQKRWDALVAAKAVFTRPYLELTPNEARGFLDPKSLLPEIAGKEVLCLASGGGQQSVAFALLGANVTVLDLSEGQLARDREAATAHGVSISAQQGDMRDLSCFADSAFDIVYQPYSINFAPEVASVFREVARVLRPQGWYRLMCANPFFLGMNPEDWDGTGYPVRLPYESGAMISVADEAWIFGEEEPVGEIAWRREYRHTLSDLLNGLTESGLTLFRFYEEHFGSPDFGSPPGTFEHFTATIPPWMIFWAIRAP